MIGKFDWVLYGYEVDDYCFSMIDIYGEESPIIRALNTEYERFSRIKVYCDRLNAIREFLCEKGFEKQVLESDKRFLNEMHEKLDTVNKYSHKLDKEIRADMYMKHIDEEIDINKFDVEKIYQYAKATGKAFHMLPIDEQNKYLS